MKHKIFTFLLVMIASTSMLFAESGTCGENLTWYLMNGVLTISGTGDMTNWYDASKVPWYRSRSSITEVSIGNSVTSIGNYAFNDCTGLTSVTIPNSVTSIGTAAFNGCTGLTSVTIPNSVTSIGNSAFSYCTGLTSVTIPNSVTSIGTAAFAGCSGLAYINVMDDNPNYSSIDGILLNKAQTKLIQYPGGNKGAYVIPNSVTSIGDFAFAECTGLTSVTIPNSVTSIGNSAFSYCTGLTSVTIPNSVTSIGTAAFAVCKGLTSVTIGNSVTSIGDHAFYGCIGLTSITIPNSVTSIGNSAFSYCTGLTSIEIPNSVTSIGDYAFYECTGLKSIIILSSVTDGGKGFLDNTTCIIFIPCEVLEFYKFVWPDYAARMYSVTQLYSYIYSYTCNVFPTIAGKVNIRNICDFSMEAVPNYGYHFVQWSDGVSDNPRTVLLTQDTTFTAEFAKNTYTIISTTEMPERGIARDTIQALYLDEVSISATAREHYHFSSWNDGNTDNPRKIMVLGDSIFEAYFAPDVYHITTYGMGGQVYGPEEDEYGTTITLNATPDHGYHFVQWTDGVTDNPRSFILTQDTAFVAEFALNTEGQCGNNLYWKYENGKLAITGSGEMYSYVKSTVPWIYWKPEIKSVTCSPEMTSLCDYAFSDINTSKFNTIILPTNLVTIGAHAFDGASFLETIDFGANLEYIGDYAFVGCVRMLNMTIWSEFTPNVGYYALTDISNYAELSVLKTAYRKFLLDNNWNRFLLKEIGAAETTVAQNDVSIVPSDNTAEVTWPTSENAASYTIQITKDGVVFCTLIFNGNGQLTGIAFAPGRDGEAHAPAALMTANGLQFTVTGLNSGTQYALTLQAKDSQNAVLASYSSNFTTTGDAQGIEDVQGNNVQCTKIVHNGQIFILRGEKVYTVTGQEVR